MRRQRQAMNRPGVRQVPEGCEEQQELEKTGCKVICGGSTTLAVMDGIHDEDDDDDDDDGDEQDMPLRSQVVSFKLRTAHLGFSDPTWKSSSHEWRMLLWGLFILVLCGSFFLIVKIKNKIQLLLLLQLL